MNLDLPLLQPVRQATDWQRNRRYWSAVRKVLKLKKSLQNLTDDALRKESHSLRFRAKSHEPLDELLVEAFALVREAARRVLSMEHFDVQLFAGAALHEGSVVQMQTGEGKTLTASLPIYLASLVGKGAHLATANDYLAARDAESLTPLYDLLGVTVGVVQNDSSRSERRRAYQCDVTYGTAKEFGFDFLRDRLRHREEQGGESESLQIWLNNVSTDIESSTVQRPFYFALIDEADSIMLDEARTPLVVSALPSGQVDRDQAACRWAADVAPDLAMPNDFHWNEERKAFELTGAGRQRIRGLAHDPALESLGLLEIYDRIEKAILVLHRYQRNSQYVIRDDEVVIVDEHTGRLAEGRKWRSGIHQAIEAKERVSHSEETGQAARLTLQSLLRRYSRLAGMTGTVGRATYEFRRIYRLGVVQVPTHRPPQRKELEPIICGDRHTKWQAILEEVIAMRATGRPVLIGTRTISHSYELAKMLKEASIPHHVLNATQHEQEASIVAKAGLKGRVTVATNMAGRGTDIKIDDEVRALGGLHVICSELHDSTRIDRQLVGRCGRQGDPGSYRQYHAFDDELIKTAWGEARSQRLQRMAMRFKPQSNSDAHARKPIGKRWLRLFERAQAKIERAHFRVRQQLLQQEEDRFEMHEQLGEDPFLDAPV